MIDLLNKVIKNILYSSDLCFVCDHNAPEIRESSKLFLLFMPFVYAERTKENHDIYDEKSIRIIFQS